MKQNVIAAVMLFATGPLFAATTTQQILSSVDKQSGLVVVLGCGEESAPKLVTDLGAGGNWLVHAVAGSKEELSRFNKAIIAANVEGCASAEQLSLAPLPYRDYMVDVLVIMDIAKAKAAGLKMAEVRRCVIPQGSIVICNGGKIVKIEKTPPCDAMDVWTHHFHDASGMPVSHDRVFNLPVGFKWNAGLPMNFNNPVRAANRYSSTRAMVVDDGRLFTFSTAVYENLGEGWTSPYGTDQYLTCRDAFNGRLLWRKRIGDTYYGGLYIENLAPLVSTGRRLYLAGEDGKMLVVDTRTGKTIRELPTTYIPGVIAADKGIVVAATWKNGKSMGSIKHYDRRRMDWEISQGTIEAYDDATGRRLWKKDLLGTSMLIADGHVYIVNRDKVDPLEMNFDRRRGKADLKHPPQKVIAMDLVSGKILWETDASIFHALDQALSLEAAAHRVVSVGLQGRTTVALLSGDTGLPLGHVAAATASKEFFRFRNHICTPVLRVGSIILSNRKGRIVEGKENFDFAGARAACLMGTIPAYGAGYIAQNWCRCSPGQIPGLMAIAPIGKVPTPAEMEAPTQPSVYCKYTKSADGDSSPSLWTSFRGNAERNSSSACDGPAQVKVAWSTKITDKITKGTVWRDRRAYLNSRLTAASIGGGLAVVGDIDHNEIIAVSLRDGTVKWRFLAGGRMDTAPTLYRGICLVGDHTGYVYALKLDSGQLIYKLRIAPQEKRMISYGKVESVWPVIGGVLVAGKTAYASAGRTQGSDGGLVIRAFVPETGKPLWAKALPQGGPGLIEKVPKRNDALVQDGQYLTIMGHWLSLDTGKVCPKPQRPTVVMGLEGLYSWNWTRLGNRKFGHIGYGKFVGDTVSWNNKYVATTGINGGGKIVDLSNPGKAHSFPGDGRVYLGTCLVLCKNLLIQGGDILDQKKDCGFIRAIGLMDGRVKWEKRFDSKLAFNGLAVDTCGIIATFDNGTVACLK